jgi:hypothetical protein
MALSPDVVAARELVRVEPVLERHPLEPHGYLPSCQPYSAATRRAMSWTAFHSSPLVRMTTPLPPLLGDQQPAAVAGVAARVAEVLLVGVVLANGLEAKAEAVGQDGL